MFWNILKRDIKRKKTMNVILLVFIIVASMFAASGANNMVAILNGTDYYMDKAGIGNYDILTMGENSVDKIDASLDKISSITSYTTEKIIYANKEDFSHDGEKVETKNTAILQGDKSSSITFFTEDNEELKSVKKGEFYVSGAFMKDNNMKVGDEIRFKKESVDITLKLAGRMKDALLGSDFMGNTRFLLNEEDLDVIKTDEIIMKYSQGEIYYVNTTNPGELDKELGDTEGIALNMSRDKMKMVYVMEMVVAGIVLLVSIVLVIIALLVLRFTIQFTLEEEYREIGVMKAIGIKNFKIRSLYIAKYFAMALVGSIVGFGLSIPFGDMLLKSASDTMVLGNDGAMGIRILGSLFIIIVTLLFAYLSTGKVKKATPVDAIRNGQTGERYKKKTVYRLSKSHAKSPFYMALNDFLSAPKRFLSIIITFTISTVLVIMIVNTSETMKSDKIIDLFLPKSDLYVTDVGKVMSFMQSDGEANIEKFFDETEKALEEKGIPAKLSLLFQYKYKAICKGKEQKVTFQQGYRIPMDKYVVMEGSVPTNKREIAVTKQVAKQLDASIGDTVTIDFGSEKIDCIVTGYFQTMNNLGEVVMLHNDAPTEFGQITSSFSYQIDFDDHPDAAEIERRKPIVNEVIENDKIMNKAEYSADSTQIVDTMDTVAKLLLLITIFVILLVTLLMERSFVSEEKSQIAILKAIGFKDRTIILWHMIRFGIIALISVFLAVLLSIPMTHLCITPIFGIMGAMKIEYYFNLVKIGLVFPGIILVCTLVIAFFAALFTKSIKASDTASIE